MNIVDQHSLAVLKALEDSQRKVRPNIEKSVFFTLFKKYIERCPRQVAMLGERKRPTIFYRIGTVSAGTLLYHVDEEGQVALLLAGKQKYGEAVKTQFPVKEIPSLLEQLADLPEEVNTRIEVPKGNTVFQYDEIWTGQDDDCEVTKRYFVIKQINRLETIAAFNKYVAAEHHVGIRLSRLHYYTHDTHETLYPKEIKVSTIRKKEGCVFPNYL